MRDKTGVANLTYRHMSVTNNLQSPNYYRSFPRPSDTKALERFYHSVEQQVAETKQLKDMKRFTCDGDKDMTEAKKKSPFL